MNVLERIKDFVTPSTTESKKGLRSVTNFMQSCALQGNYKAKLCITCPMQTFGLQRQRRFVRGKSERFYLWCCFTQFANRRFAQGSKHWLYLCKPKIRSFCRLVQISDLQAGRRKTKKTGVVQRKSWWQSHLSFRSKKRFGFKEKNISIVVPNIFWYSTFKSSYTIVRPLLNLSRCNITMSCILYFLPVYPDLTNLKTQYSRNRIRKQIVPTIELFLNPKVDKALFSFSEFLNIESGHCCEAELFALKTKIVQLRSKING